MKKILVIEDEQDILDNTLEVLDLENYVTLGALNGRIGIKLALEEIPDLILCDIRMPEMDGFTVYDQLQGNPKTARIPFVFVSSRANLVGMDEVQASHVRYLPKPYEIGKLLAMIREIFEN